MTCYYLDTRNRGEDCAVIYGQIDDDLFAKKIDFVGRMYNNALLGVEINNIGHSVVNTLLNVTFHPNLYYHDIMQKLARMRQSQDGLPI